MSSTSPSIYVKFPLVSASDSCGLIGPAVTSITLAFSPWELSTYEWNSPAGTTLALDTADLPCGPWNGTNHFLPELWSNSSYYQPLIVLPSKLIDVVPTWKSCTADIFEGQDPPRTLSPAAAMVPTPKNADTHAQKSLASPSPSIPRLPLKTGAGNFQPADPGPTPSSPSMPADPSTWDSGDSSSTSSPSKPNDPSTGDPGDSHGPANSAVSLNASPASGLTQTLAGDPPVNRPLNPSVADPNDKKNTLLAFPAAVALQSYTITQGAAPVTISRTAVVYQSGSISAGGEIEAIPTDWGEGNRIASPMTVGGLTFSAIPYLAKAYGDPQTGNDDAANAAQIKDSAADNPNLVTYIAVGSHTIAVDPDAISVAGMTLKPGDPGVTIDGTPISLGSSVFVVGSRTETISPSPAVIPSQTPYVTVGGQTISIYSNAIIVDGKTLKPADPGITVDGTSVSLGSSILVVGSHTQNLILPQPTPTAVAAPSYMTVGEEIIAVAASSIVVAGHTMTPGDPAVMADGKLVSLGSSVLVVGTQTMSFTLPTAGASVSSGEGIGAMIMKGLGGIGAGIVASPTQTAGYNGTRGGNATMVFTGDAKEYSTHRFRGWVAWVGTLLLYVL